VDVYALIHLPDGRVLSIRRGGRIVPGVAYYTRITGAMPDGACEQLTGYTVRPTDERMYYNIWLILMPRGVPVSLQNALAYDQKTLEIL
jgi:hypothetical protein